MVKGAVSIHEPVIHAAIKDVSEDMYRSDGPHDHGFKAMFKDFEAVDHLEPMFEKLAARSPRPNILKSGRILPSAAPVFVCITKEMGRKYNVTGGNPWQKCKREPWTYGYYFPKTAYIGLCPQFFDLPSEPVLSAAACPTVHNNRFVEVEEAGTHGHMITRNRPYMLLHHLIHFYLERPALPSEVYSLNGCAKLTPPKALRNPYSYIYYVASESCGVPLSALYKSES